jgi:hypothetical protein
VHEVTSTHHFGINDMHAHRTFRLALLGAAFAASTAQAAVVNLINNGDFETGDFTGWTQFGNTTFNGVACSPGFGAGSPCASFFGPIGSAGGISQTLTGLDVGGEYILSFQLQNSADVPSFFAVTFGTTTIYSETNPPASGPVGAYKGFNFNMQATAATQTLSFTFRDDPGFFILDKVAVTVPEPTTLALVAAALAGLGFARRERRGAIAA